MAASQATKSIPARPGARLPYRLSIDGCLSSVIGSSGLTPAKLDHWLARVEPHVARLRTQYEDGSLPL